MSQVEDQDSLSIKPSQEEIDFRQRTSNFPRGISAPVQTGQGIGRHPSTSGLLWLTLVFVLASSGGLYWRLQQSNQQQQAQQQRLEALSQSVHVLEQKLNITGKTASSSLTVLQSTIKTQDSEIRKLWDVANKRNKSWISELQMANSTYKKQITQLQATLKQLQQEQGNTHQAQQVVDKQLTTIQSTLNALKTATQDTESQYLAIKAKIETLQSKVGSVPSSVQKKMDDIEKAIAAIDATRIQQARNITQLGEEIKQLRSEVMPSTQVGSGILAQ